MASDTTIQSKSESIGRLTLGCRYLCSFLIAAPWLYFNFVTNGDAYHFLAIVILAPVAGVVLIGNSLFCLYRYRHVESFWVAVFFSAIGVMGFLAAWHYLPEFRM